MINSDNAMPNCCVEGADCKELLREIAATGNFSKLVSRMFQ